MLRAEHPSLCPGPQQQFALQPWVGLELVTQLRKERRESSLHQQLGLVKVLLCLGESSKNHSKYQFLSAVTEDGGLPSSRAPAAAGRAPLTREEQKQKHLPG